jgi:hypothetical protein
MIAKIVLDVLAVKVVMVVVKHHVTQDAKQDVLEHV